MNYGMDTISILIRNILKIIELVLDMTREYNYSNKLKRSAFEAYFTVLTILNTDIFYNYEYAFYDSHLVSEFENFIKSLC